MLSRSTSCFNSGQGRSRAEAGMDVNKPPDPTRNAARLRMAMEALTFDFFFTTDPTKTEPLLDHLLSEPGRPTARLTVGA